MEFAAADGILGCWHPMNARAVGTGRTYCLFRGASLNVVPRFSRPSVWRVRASART